MINGCKMDYVKFKLVKAQTSGSQTAGCAFRVLDPFQRVVICLDRDACAIEGET